MKINLFLAISIKLHSDRGVYVNAVVLAAYFDFCSFFFGFRGGSNFAGFVFIVNSC